VSIHKGCLFHLNIELDGQKRAYYRRDNEEIEFEISKYHDGAHDQLKVEAVWFSDATIKQYYLDNFEDIDQQVIDYKLSKPSKPVKKEYKKINFLDKIKTVKKTPTPQKKSKPVKPTRKAKPGLKGVESTEEIEETIDIDQLDEPTPIVVEIPVELVPVVEKVEPTPEKSNIKSKKIKGLNNVADAMQTQTQNPTYQIGGAIKDLLGNIEIKPTHSVAITLDAEQGAGKTRFMFQFANEFAKNGYKVLINSNEEHPESSSFQIKN
jgi:hypothetical protein